MAKSNETGELQFTLSLTGQFSADQTIRTAAQSIAPGNLPTRVRKLVEGLVAKHPEWSNSKIEDDDQFDWLTDRAELFSGLGAWKPAIDLWQAALLVRPRDVELRLRLIHDQRRLLKEMATTEYATSKWPGPIGSPGRAERLIGLYLDQLRNEEFLIRNRLIDTVTARRVLSQRGYVMYQSGIRESEAENQATDLESPILSG